MWCNFGANLVQHFMRRYSRYRTKSHDKATISNDITRYSRYQTVLLKLQEIISTFGRIQKMLNLGWAFFYYIFENVEINPLRDFRYVADATRYAYGSICLLRKREIYLISSLSKAKIYRICRKANISSRAKRGISTKIIMICFNQKGRFNL